MPIPARKLRISEWMPLISEHARWMASAVVITLFAMKATELLTIPWAYVWNFAELASKTINCVLIPLMATSVPTAANLTTKT